MKSNFRNSLFGTLLLVCILMIGAIGCNAIQTAQNFESVINGILQIAQAEIPALPPADAAVLQPWAALGMRLDGQLQTCIAGAGAAGGKAAAFLSCFNTFAAGVASPAELAQLRVLSPSSQKKAQLWTTAIILGVNAALVAFKGQKQALPQIAAVQPSRQEIHTLAARLELSPAYGF